MPDMRSESRHEVAYRVRVATGGGRGELLLVVNISPHGLMARTEAAFSLGQEIVIDLPVIGDRTVHVRWTLGGRIGCEFAEPIATVQFDRMLHELLRSK